MKIIDNAAEGARRVSTTKHGGPITPKYIVMHATVGYTTAGDVATLSTSDRPASIHNVIGRDGEIVQIVPYNMKAWHAGPSAWHGDVSLNDCSIGIELSNIEWLSIRPDGNYEDEYNNVISPDGNFANGRRATSSPPKNWPRYTHERLGHAPFAWEPYTAATLGVLDALIPALFAAYPSLQEVVQHQWIDTRTGRTDPGPQFPMGRYTKFNRNQHTTPGARLATFVPTVSVPQDPGLATIELTGTVTAVTTQTPVPAANPAPAPVAQNPKIDAPVLPTPAPAATPGKPREVVINPDTGEQSLAAKIWNALWKW